MVQAQALPDLWKLHWHGFWWDRWQEWWYWKGSIAEQLPNEANTTGVRDDFLQMLDDFSSESYSEQASVQPNDGRGGEVAAEPDGRARQAGGGDGNPDGAKLEIQYQLTLRYSGAASISVARCQQDFRLMHLQRLC